MKRVLEFSKVLLLIFVVGIPNYLVNASNSYGISKDEVVELTDEVFGTKKFNVEREECLKRKYGNDWTTSYKRNILSVQSAQRIESNFLRNSNGNVVYPSYFGGLYINDDDDLVFQIVDSKVSKLNSKDLKKYNNLLQKSDDAVIENVKYSYNDICNINQKLENLFLDGKLPESVTSFYIDVIGNRIIVELSDDSKSQISSFKDIIDSPIIVFKKGELSTVSLDAGAPSGTGGSVGYRARKSSSGQGYVTYGHKMTLNSVISGKGKVENKKFGGHIDASWINTNGYSATPTNNWHQYPPYVMPTLSLSTAVKTKFYVGEKIGRVGMATGHQTGKITSTSWAGHVKECDSCSATYFTKMIKTDVHHIPGDSGGIVYSTTYIPNPAGGNSQEHITAGIGTIKDSEDHMIFSRADYINSAFGLSRY